MTAKRIWMRGLHSHTAIRTTCSLLPMKTWKGDLPSMVDPMYTRHFSFSHRPSPLINSTFRPNTLQGVDFGSVFGQFLVVFGQKCCRGGVCGSTAWKTNLNFWHFLRHAKRGATWMVVYHKPPLLDQSNARTRRSKTCQKICKNTCS